MATINETIDIQLAMIDMDMQTTAARANWWVHYATSQVNQTRQLFKGSGQCDAFTTIEKEQDAFDIANNHIRRMDEMLIEKRKLLNKKHGIGEEE